MTVAWSNQSLVFDYYFPNYGNVFTGSPIAFVANGSQNLSTFSNLDPATFSVSSVTSSEVQISYSYPLASYPNGLSLTTAPFNGFTIPGPAGDSPIAAVSVDASSTVTGLVSSALSFTNDSATVNLAGDVFSPGSVGLIDVAFAVPEPSSVALLASGLLVVFAINRLRRS
jgi:hypothetical protein